MANITDKYSNRVIAVAKMPYIQEGALPDGRHPDVRTQIRKDCKVMFDYQDLETKSQAVSYLVEMGYPLKPYMEEFAPEHLMHKYKKEAPRDFDAEMKAYKKVRNGEIIVVLFLAAFILVVLFLIYTFEKDAILAMFGW